MHLSSWIGTGNGSALRERTTDMKRSASLLCLVLAALGGFVVGQNAADTSAAKRVSYEDGFNAGTCRPLVYEDGSYVLEDGRGHLCVKP